MDDLISKLSTHIVHGWRRYPKCARMVCFFGYNRTFSNNKIILHDYE